jgi:hypothetical protein
VTMDGINRRALVARSRMLCCLLFSAVITIEDIVAASRSTSWIGAAESPLLLVPHPPIWSTTYTRRVRLSVATLTPHGSCRTATLQ